MPHYPKPGEHPRESEENPVAVAVANSRYLKHITAPGSARRMREGLKRAGFPDDHIERTVTAWQKRLSRDGDKVVDLYAHNWAATFEGTPPQRSVDVLPRMARPRRPAPKP